MLILQCHTGVCEETILKFHCHKVESTRNGKLQQLSRRVDSPGGCCSEWTPPRWEKVSGHLQKYKDREFVLELTNTGFCEGSHK